MSTVAPIVGRPVVYGVGLLVLLVLGLSRFVGRYPLTLAHEGGHLLAAVAVLRPIHGFAMADNTEAVTVVAGRRWSFGNLIFVFAGYPAPSLLGWGGAALVASGRGWFVMVVGVLLCVLALFVARNGLAVLVPALVGLGVGWALVQGSPTVQAAVVVGIVWYLLLGGLLDAVTLPAGDGDAASLRRRTVLVPGLVWKGIWIVIALYCLYRGGSLLIVGS